jgi:serine/threonine protein kinase
VFFKRFFASKQPDEKEESGSISLEDVNRSNLDRIFNNRYQLEKVLSDSSYLVIDIKRERRVVIKHIKFKTNRSVYLNEITNFIDLETVKLVKLTDSCHLIPKLIDYVKEGSNFYLISEYIEGKTISEELANSQPSELAIAKLLKEILTELQSFHDRNIIHKSIEANQIIRRASDLKLMFIYYGDIDEKCYTTSYNEFFDNIPKELQVSGVPCLTPSTWSPEFRAGQPQFSSDLYAMGLMGIQLSIGISLRDIPMNPATGNYLWENYSQFSDRLVSIVNRMVECSLRIRYKTISEVLDDLNLFIEWKIDNRSIATAIWRSDLPPLK